MTSDPLAHIYKKLGEHLQAGDEIEAREHLAQELQNLPEETRNEVMFELFIDGLQKEVTGKEVIAKLQEEGVTAAEELLEVREELEKIDSEESSQKLQ